jgi:hypothetical protein
MFSETENGAIALNTTGNCILDYFMILTRTLPKKNHNNYLEKCWKINPEYTIAIIFNGRDRKNGKKEKKISNTAMLWLRENKPKTYSQNILTYVNKYGCWKDMLYIAYNTTTTSHVMPRDYELELFAIQLRKDKTDLQNNTNISLCGKWAPSENDKYDTRKQFAKKIATILYSSEDIKRMEKYRREYLVPLRKNIDIVERLMCNNEWEKINYSTVPGVASRRLFKAFMKHDEERYKQFLDSVKKGEKEIKITGLLPHDLLKYYMDNNDNTANDTIELQWKTMLDNVRNSGILSSSIAVVDLSGSMFCASNGDIPARVSATLGIMTSLCCKEPFYKRLITFSHNPTFVNLPNETLFDCYNAIRNVDYGLNTDLLKTCETIIEYGINNNIPDEKMIEKLFVFTDMQFDRASSTDSNITTLYTTICNSFTKNNYTPPKFIFWNLNSDTLNTFPVDFSVNNTALVSGFSEQLLKIFMQYDEFNPKYIIDEILQPYLKDVIIVEDER